MDIKPLIPPHLPETLKQTLSEVFDAEFKRVALEEHPELPLADNKEYLSMLMFGHKMFKSQRLEDVKFPSPNTPTSCSTYVAITFLKAIQKMNQHLEEQGLEERISHPFGEHENLMNMDILRLLYLWKEIKVLKPSPINKTLEKVFSSMSSL